MPGVWALRWGWLCKNWGNLPLLCASDQPFEPELDWREFTRSNSSLKLGERSLSSTFLHSESVEGECFLSNLWRNLETCTLTHICISKCMHTWCRDIWHVCKHTHKHTHMHTHSHTHTHTHTHAREHAHIMLTKERDGKNQRPSKPYTGQRQRELERGRRGQRTLGERESEDGGRNAETNRPWERDGDRE